ncbi:MAG: hypothetical protein KC897_01195 [Candidatus Omnitrophica bacterium]|nr:hypothetical protein [Candidatus Omnitrophota bacterium]MCB9720098.1 hypothetical protein [Candidatus Omnitrophota bacterium]
MKIILRIVLYISLAFIGAAAGGAVGGTFFVAPGSGLAGGAIVLTWVLAGALVIPLTGLYLCRRLDVGGLRRVCLICGAIAAVLAGLLTWRVRQLKDSAGAREQPPAGRPTSPVR